MKFKTYLMENESGSLIGKMINGKIITEKTKTEHWTGNFSCANNQLTSLVGAPASVEIGVNCANNHLTSLVGAPTSVGFNFNCAHNRLTSLVGAPASVSVNFWCDNNQLTSLVGAPASVYNFNCFNNQLTSLRGIHKEIKRIGIFKCADNPIKEAVLGLLLIKGLIKVDGLPCDDIINKYLPNKTGMEAVSRCQDELEEAGFGEFAEL